MQGELIISIDRFRAITSIYDTFDENFLWGIIERSSDIIINEILGTALFNKLITDYNADSLTGIYETMYNTRGVCSVEKMVAWQAFQKGAVRMTYRVQNSGIAKSSGTIDEGTVISRDELADLINDCEGAVIDYTNQVKSFLSRNFKDIPELQNADLDYLKPNLKPSEPRVGFGTTPGRVWDDI